jgi:hypothetical protein
MKEYPFAHQNGQPVLVLDGSVAFRLQTMHGQSLPKGIYRVDLLAADSLDPGAVEVDQVGASGTTAMDISSSGNTFSIEISMESGSTIKISGPENMALNGIKIEKMN